MADRDLRGGSLLQVPGGGRRGLSPVRHRSKSRSRTRRSGSPLPYLMKGDREKSPFEIGDTRAMLKAAPKCVFDKALVMDISPSVAKSGDEEVIYITTDMSVIDKALVMDVSSVTLIVLEDEDEEEEIEIDLEDLPEEEKALLKPDGEEGDEAAPEEKKKIKKVIKKKKKKVVAKKEPTPPLKLEIKVPKKNLKGMFEQPKVEEPVAKKPVKAAKLEKLKMMERMKAEAAAAAEEEEKMKVFEAKKKQAKFDAASNRKPKEVEPSGLQAVLDKQKKKLDDAKKKASGIVDPLDIKKKSKGEIEVHDFQSGLRKVSVDITPSDSPPNEDNYGNDDTGVELKLRPIVQSTTSYSEDEDSDEDKNRGDDDAEPSEHSEQEDEDHTERDGSDSEGDAGGDDGRRESYHPTKSDEENDPTLQQTAELERIFFEARQRKQSTQKTPNPQQPDGKKWEQAKEEENKPNGEPAKTPVQIASEREKDREFQRQRELTRPPVFEAKLIDRTVREYEALKLSCTASGPDLISKWLKNGIIVEKSPRIKIHTRDGNLSIEIPKPVISDSGTYQCVVKNKNGEATTQCKIEVYKEVLDQPVAPSFSLVRDYYHSHDDELILECHVRAEPAPVVTFYKDGLQIVPNMRYKVDVLEHGYHRLTITKPLPSDSGKYSIKAVNEVKRSDNSHDVHFSGKDSHLHVYGIYHSDPKRQHEKSTISKSHEETMEILAHAGKNKESKGGKSRDIGEIFDSKKKLYWGSQLRDRTTTEGTKVKLVCSVVGPEPQMKWFKNDLPMAFGSKIRNSSKDCVGAIEFMNPTADDSAEYKCIAKNGASEISTSCKLNIYPPVKPGAAELPPTFVMGLRDVYHAQENDLIIDCKVRGNPIPSVAWLLDNVTIEPSDRIQQIQHHDGVCELIINKPTKRDSGNYTCRAENSMGVQKSTHNVEVTVLQPTHSVISSSIVPAPATNGHAVEETNGDVAVEAEDAAAPASEAKGKAAGKEPKGKKGRARPIETLVSVKNKLVMTANLTNRTVAARTRVKLSCCCQGPEPQMKWMKNGTPLVFSTKVKNLSRDGLGIIEFIAPCVDDSGIYECICKNPFSEISTTCTLTVYESNLSNDAAPTFTRTIKDTYHLNTNELIIECHIRGEPKPKITWYKDGEEVETNDKYQQVDHDDGTCELMINKPTIKDSGKYVCNAENSVGKAELTHFVQYEGKAHHIADNIHGAYHIDFSKLKEKEEGHREHAATDEDGTEKKGKKSAGGRKARPGNMPVPIQNLSFVAFLTDRCVAEGTKVKLSCYVQGPEPQLRWLKNDIPLVVGPKIKNLSRDGLGVIEFLNAKVEDSGEYKCIAKNATGEVTTTAKLEVFKMSTSLDIPPTFTRAIKDTYHITTNEIIIEAHCRGVPPPEISWIRNSLRIENNAKYQIIQHEGGSCELVINNPVTSDSGKYICVAENRVKKEEISHLIEFESKARIVPESHARAAPEPVVEETPIADEIAETEAPAADDDAGKKPADAAGKKPVKGKKAGGEGGRRNKGVYAPMADAKSNLYFTAGIANRTVPVGSRFKFTGYVSGPEPQVKWLKNGIPLAFGPKIRNIGKENLAVIEFMNVTMDDDAEYTCIAKNFASEVTSTARLTVYATSKSDCSPPTFTRAIKDSYNPNTKDLLIECLVTGTPIPIVTWLKDGVKIIENSRYSLNDNGDNTHSLLIKNPTISDNGKYTCRAENIVNKEEISHFIYLSENDLNPDRSKSKVDKSTSIEPRKSKKSDIRNRLAFETSLKDLTVEEGNFMKLVCSVKGDDPKVKWYKGSELIDSADGRYICGNRNGILSLEISQVSLKDSGDYSVVVKNDINEITTLCRVDVFKKTIIPPTFTRSLKETFTANKSQLIIETTIFGKPKPTIVWLRNGDIIPSGKYEQIHEKDGVCRLIIDHPRTEDSGFYTCRAEANGVSDETTAYITTYEEPVNDSEEIAKRVMPQVYIDRDRSLGRRNVRSLSNTREQSYYNEFATPDKYYKAQHNNTHFTAEKQKPVFSTYLTDRLSAEGSTVTLTCNIVGAVTDVAWYKNQRPISNNNPRYRTLIDDGLVTLEIFNATPDDSGNYLCVARNKYGDVSTTSRVKVYAGFESMPLPPTFTRSIKDSYYLQEDELVLECRVRGEPKPKITWFKDGIEITSSDKYRQLDQSDGYCKLIINEPATADSGVYTCQAENSIHTEKIGHSVEFTGKDQLIQERVHGFYHRDPNKPHFSNLLTDHSVPVGGTIALQAEVHGQVNVEWLREREPIEPTERVRTFVDQGVYTLTIEQATPQETGSYTCRAANAFGEAHTMANVDIVPAVMKGGKPALFLSRPESQMAFVSDDDISISFRVQGEPKPKLTLLKGLRDITKSPRTLKEVSDDYTRFTLKRSSYGDSGTYCIIARNRFGADRAFTTVTVHQRTKSLTPSSCWNRPLEMNFTEVSYFKNPPGPIPAEPVVIDQGKNHVSLSWMKPKYVANSAAVLAYRVETWMVGVDGGARWKELGVTPLNSFDAFNLKVGSEYHFRVTPRNRHGWGESAQTQYPILIGGSTQLPEFVKILPGQLKALIGRDITLECVVKGKPNPTIVWYKEGVEVDSGEKLSIQNVGSICRLVIQNIDETDSARYSCEATNRQGRVSTFARIQVVSDERIYEAYNKLKKFVDGEICEYGEMLPQFTMRLRDRRVQVTYPVRLTCQAIGWPTPEVKWYKDGAEIYENDLYSMWNEDNFFTLEISKTSLDDNAKYKAKAFNALGSVSCYCHLVVDKGIRGYIAPEFYCGLDSFYIFKKGEEIRISAQVEAYPTVGVTWHRDGIKLRPNRRIVTTLDHDGFVELIIADANKFDTGIYTCVASNAVGRVETSSKVMIDVADEESMNGIPRINEPNELYSKEPVFVKKPRSSEAYEGDTVIILCEVIGDPKPEVIWLRDFLKPDYYIDAPHFRRVGDGPQYRLEIPRAKLDYTGTYSVIARNCYGEAKAIISLQIFAKDLDKANMDKTAVKHGNLETLPEFVTHLKDLKCCDGDSVTLECRVTGKPEPTITWEKDGRRLPHSADFETEFNDGVARLAISHVYPEDEGEYLCTASNSIGRQSSSACIVVDVPEEKENHLSRQLTRPPGFRHSANSTPRSTPRSTPNRSVSPMPLSYRATNINIEKSTKKHKTQAPKFLSIPHNRVAEEGETVRFQCVVEGHPHPWSTWDKNGTIVITPSARINIKEKDDCRILEIEEITVEDAGLYRITLENEYGRIEATARLDVIGNRGSRTRMMRTLSSSPRRNLNFSKRIMGNSTRIGGRLSLACNYRGSSTPSSRFYHNGTEIPPSDRIKIKLLDHQITLSIDNVQLSDQGEYTCVCESDDGVASSSALVHVYDSDEDIPFVIPEFVRPLGDIETKEGAPIDLICHVDCCVPFDVVWKRDDKIIQNSNDFEYIDYGYGTIGLRILDPFTYDSGVYQCLVSTEFGVCSTECDLIIDELNEMDMYDPPEFLKEPLALVCMHGSVVSFSCRVKPESAQVRWSICGSEINDKSRGYSIERQTDGYQILHILGVEHKHSGEIKCTAYSPNNVSNSVSCYTDLTVLPATQTHHRRSILDLVVDEPTIKYIPAYIEKRPDDCTVLIGGTVALDVQFSSYPEPEVIWMRAGRVIEESDTIQIITKNGHSRLLLTNITANQSGKYTVEVVNTFGRDMASASVAVEGVPDPPSGKPSISQNTSNAFTVTWRGPPYDGGCMITGFILEMQENNNDWIELATIVDSLSYTVKTLSTESHYRFRVRAENIHGLSEPSEVSDEAHIKKESPIQSNPVIKPSNAKISIKSGTEFKSNYETLEELGKGRFGVVHRVQEKETGTVLAAKIIKCIKAKDRVKVMDEIEIMDSLKHDKLLQLAAAFEQPKEIIMVMEYIIGGELFERVVADDFTLTERDCILFVRQICEGVEYMHTKSIVHLDLKPENIMCNTRHSHQIKIIDFGLAQKLTPGTPVRVLFGTPEFIPPEIISYEPIGFLSDMWSVGVICYVLLSGLSPFMGDTDVETFANITRADFDFDDDAFDTVSQEAKDFISNLLVHRKEKRLSATQCLASEWLALENDDMTNVRICTDKLKKFIIRRKWQKTGNAIRALGRMSLQARRTSNSSVGNSPRPSISGPSSSRLLLETQSHMSSLNEDENDLTDNIKLEQKQNSINAMKMLSNKVMKSCSERSDSGFSECSNCSGPNNNGSPSNGINNTILSILEENPTDLINGSDLKQKVQRVNSNSSTDSSKSNLIAERKKSLEYNSKRELLIMKTRPSVKNVSCKVSQLKEKFLERSASNSTFESGATRTEIRVGPIFKKRDAFLQGQNKEMDTTNLRAMAFKQRVQRVNISNSSTGSSKSNLIVQRTKTLELNFKKVPPINKTQLNLKVASYNVSQLRKSFMERCLQSSFEDGATETKIQVEPIIKNRYKFLQGHKKATVTAKHVPATNPTATRLSGRIKEITDRLSAPKTTTTTATKPMAAPSAIVAAKSK